MAPEHEANCNSAAHYSWDVYSAGTVLAELSHKNWWPFLLKFDNIHEASDEEMRKAKENLDLPKDGKLGDVPKVLPLSFNSLTGPVDANGRPRLEIHTDPSHLAARTSTRRQSNL